jgi:hypothetical protein
MAAQIMVQQVDANNDPIEGANGPVFLSDIDAVAQILATRLKLLQGEWWENLSIGLPLFQSMIGTSAAPANQAAVLLILQTYIMATPFVLEILDFDFEINLQFRASTFRCEVSTQFGTLTVTNAPGSSAVVNP